MYETLSGSPEGVFIFLMQKKRIRTTLSHYSPTALKSSSTDRSVNCRRGNEDCFCQADLPLRAESISVTLFQMKRENRSYWDKTRSAWIWHMAVYGWLLSHRVTMAPQHYPYLSCVLYHDAHFLREYCGDLKKTGDFCDLNLYLQLIKAALF